MSNTVKINDIDVEIAGERNLLELIRKAGIDLPTFCYHSELSIYGACRLCLVEVAGKGIMASCSTKPEDGMVVHTDTKALRDMRKISVELLLANHNRECPSCPRSANCTLQDLARRLGVKEIRYKQSPKDLPIDKSSPSLERDPNKCVLCGDCVRVCNENQTVGAIDIAFRGAHSRVTPAFDQNLNDVECVNCGQCAAVCPTGAIVPKQDCDKVWDAIYDPEKTVVVQVAPAVRVALGDYFGFKDGANVERQMISALKLMGFDQVYDTCYAADMTIFEEATELLDRVGNGGKLPMFTSCCPAWVKFAEIYFPEMLPNISTTRSPQQIFGAVAREVLPAKLNVKPENLVVVSVMPCTAKKFEAQLNKFKKDGRPDVDYVLTTIELAQMIESMGINLAELPPEAFDQPYGFSTGGGVIFGATGGVMEAALRYAVEKIEQKPLAAVDFKEVRGLEGIKDATYHVGGMDVKVAVAHGLGNARKLVEAIKAGKADYQFVEVMSCPGGCVSGGGQPINNHANFRKERAAGLYATDKARQLQKSQDNYLVDECYKTSLGGAPGSHKAHTLLHTHYQNRGQLFDAKQPVLVGTAAKRLPVCVTICANGVCNGKETLAGIVAYIKENKLNDFVDVSAAYSARPDANGTIAVTIGEMALGSGELPLAALCSAISDGVKAL